jgi:hypothetical protein
MNNLNSVISLAYDQRKQIGKEIKVYASEFYKRKDLVTTIKEVGVCPWSNQARMMYLITFESLPTATPFRARMQIALNRVVEYFDNDSRAMDLRVTYFTEAESTIWTSAHLHMMLESKEFEAVN